MGAEDLLVRLRIPTGRESAVSRALPPEAVPIAPDGIQMEDHVYYVLDAGSHLIELMMAPAVGDPELSVRFAVSQPAQACDSAAAVVLAVAEACAADITIADEVPGQMRSRFKHPDYDGVADSIRAAALEQKLLWERSFGVDERKSTCLDAIRRVTGWRRS